MNNIFMKTWRVLVPVILSTLITWILLILYKERRNRQEGYKRVPKDDDWTQAHFYALKKIAIDKGYIVFNEDNRGLNFEAKHTKETCRQFQDSIDDNITLEWHNNKCVMVPKILKTMCNETDEDLIYNVGDSTCRTTCKYCRKKLTEWDGTDCFLPPTKRITTTLFGDTLGKVISETSIDTLISSVANEKACNENNIAINDTRDQNNKWWTLEKKSPATSTPV